MVPSTTDTIADNPPPPSPRPLPPPPVSPSLNLSWCQQRGQERQLLSTFGKVPDSLAEVQDGCWRSMDFGARKICQSCTRVDSAEWHLGEIDDMICWRDFSVYLYSSNLFSLRPECEHLLWVKLFSNPSMGQQWFESANRRTGSKR